MPTTPPRVSLDRKVVIEKPVITKDSIGAAARTWQQVATVWAEVMDTLPSRAESVQAGVQQQTQAARVRIRWRSDINATMRVRDERGRVLQIVGGPSEIGRRQYLEIYCEAYSTAGSA